MGILIPGRTACAICNTVIDRRCDAAQLPYLDPSKVSSPRLLTRPFVHRECWSGWEQRGDVLEAALILLQKSREDTEVRELKYAEDGMAMEVWRSGFVRVHDIRLLVVFDLPFSCMTEFRGRLSETTTDSTPTVVEEVGIHITQMPSGEGTEVYAIDGDGELIWSVELSRERRAKWLAALDAVID